MSEVHPIPKNPHFIDITGKKYGRLMIVSYAGKYRWNCQCDCGKKKAIYMYDIRSGKSLSCGCLRAEQVAKRMKTHGATAGKWADEYRCWVGMKQRCLNPKHPQYSDYGGRGIIVSDKWKTSFAAFLKDMGPRPSLIHSLDRHPDQNGGYEPGNVRWATPKEQGRNSRINHLLTHNGETWPISVWAEKTGLSPQTIASRLNHLKWPVEKALSAKLKFKGHGLRWKRQSTNEKVKSALLPDHCDT